MALIEHGVGTHIVSLESRTIKETACMGTALPIHRLYPKASVETVTTIGSHTYTLFVHPVRIEYVKYSGYPGLWID